jgi:hypothetical protein
LGKINWEDPIQKPTLRNNSKRSAAHTLDNASGYGNDGLFSPNLELRTGIWKERKINYFIDILAAMILMHGAWRVKDFQMARR